MLSGNENDLKKYTYHEAARLIRYMQDRICELAYTGTSPTPDERETLCDMLIELHQLLYGVTLHTFRSEDHEADDGYEDDEIYSDGRPVITRFLFPADLTDDPIPADAYRSDTGENIPPGGTVYVWRPGDPNYTGIRTDEDAYVVSAGDYDRLWKSWADLRASGLLDCVRDDTGHIVKGPGPDGRLTAVAGLTTAGRDKAKRLLGMSPDSPDTRGGPADV